MGEEAHEAPLPQTHENHNAALLGPVLQESAWYSTASLQSVSEPKASAFGTREFLLFYEDISLLPHPPISPNILIFTFINILTFNFINCYFGVYQYNCVSFHLH